MIVNSVYIITTMSFYHILHLDVFETALESTSNELCLFHELKSNIKPIPAIVLYCATCINIRNVIIAMVTPVVIKSYDK